MSSQPEVSKFAPELVTGVTNLARSLVAATRNWTLYPAEHPAVLASFGRLSQAIQEATNDAVLTIAVIPDGLLIEGFAVPASQPVIEAARLLHDCGLLQLTFSGTVPAEAVAKLLRMLSLDKDTLRLSGGPEGVWATEGHPSITLEQIDYAYVLEDKDAQPDRTHDDVWKSIVRSIVSGAKTMDEMAQRRLLEIAGDPRAIGDLAAAVIAPLYAMDGSPMITTQAAAVLGAYRHLASIVAVKAADQSESTMRNLAAAAADLDPHVVMQMMQGEDDPSAAVQLVQGLIGAFDDTKVAHLLATALAADGRTSTKLADVFHTIAPDPERKLRVLKMARKILSESEFGQTRRFAAIWSSMEELLVSYNDKPFVSELYQGQLDGVTARAEALGLKDLPEEMPEWIETLGQQNVRKLSVTLIIDLLKLERDETRAAEIADDMTALAEDLLMSGDYDEARDVITALTAAAGNEAFAARVACGEALERLATSAAMHETVGILGEMEKPHLAVFTEMCRLIGVPTVDVLGLTMTLEGRTPARLRAADIIVTFGAPAVPRLAAFANDERSSVQCHAADLLGRIASPEAVPILQPLLRGDNPKVTRHAVTALASIDDPAAARAIHMVLRTATGEQRRAVIEALVAGRDARVVPMLVRILDESEPLGKDRAVVLDTLGALKIVHTDNAVRPIASVARRRRWYTPARNRALKNHALDALASIDTDASRGALTQAATDGDRLLRKLAKARLRGAGS